MIEAAHRMDPSKTFRWRVIVPLDNQNDSARIEKMGYTPGARPAAYICRGRTCLPPVFDPEALGDLGLPGAADSDSV